MVSHKAKKGHIIYVRLDDKDLGKVQNLADALGITCSAAIRLMIVQAREVTVPVREGA